jgi:hypothetical protein
MPIDERSRDAEPSHGSSRTPGGEYMCGLGRILIGGSAAVRPTVTGPANVMYVCSAWSMRRCTLLAISTTVAPTCVPPWPLGSERLPDSASSIEARPLPPQASPAYASFASTEPRRMLLIFTIRSSRGRVAGAERMELDECAGRFLHHTFHQRHPRGVPRPNSSTNGIKYAFSRCAESDLHPCRGLAS